MSGSKVEKTMDWTSAIFFTFILLSHRLRQTPYKQMCLLEMECLINLGYNVIELVRTLEQIPS